MQNLGQSSYVNQHPIFSTCQRPKFSSYSARFLPHFDATASLSTILVVQPRQARQGYKIENGVLLNTGNTVYLASAEAPCIDGAAKCEKEKYLIPGGQLLLQGLKPGAGKLFIINEKIEEHVME